MINFKAKTQNKVQIINYIIKDRASVFQMYWQ